MLFLFHVTSTYKLGYVYSPEPASSLKPSEPKSLITYTVPQNDCDAHNHAGIVHDYWQAITKN